MITTILIATGTLFVGAYSWGSLVAKIKELQKDYLREVCKRDVSQARVWSTIARVADQKPIQFSESDKGTVYDLTNDWANYTALGRVIITPTTLSMRKYNGNFDVDYKFGKTESLLDLPEITFSNMQVVGADAKERADMLNNAAQALIFTQIYYRDDVTGKICGPMIDGTVKKLANATASKAGGQ